MSHGVKDGRIARCLSTLILCSPQRYRTSHSASVTKFGLCPLNTDTWPRKSMQNREKWNMEAGFWILQSKKKKFFFFLHYCPRPAFVSPTHLFCFLRPTNEGNGGLGPYKAILARSQLRRHDMCFYALVGDRRFCLYFQIRRHTHSFQSDVTLFNANFLNPEIEWKCSCIHWTHAHMSWVNFWMSGSKSGNERAMEIKK